MSDGVAKIEGVRRPNVARAAALLIAQGMTLEKAAEQLGIGRRTLSRWNATDTFLAEVDKLQTELITAAMRRLSSVMTAAVDTLADLLKNTNPWVARCAARDLLELSAKFNERKVVNGADNQPPFRILRFELSKPSTDQDVIDELNALLPPEQRG